MNEEYLNTFLSEFGQPTFEEKLALDKIEKYRNKLPNSLLDLWREYGFCGFKNGLLWLTNPADYEECMDEWIGDTPIVEEDAYYVIARNGFGDLYLWGEKFGSKYKINTRMGWILPQKDDNRLIKKGKADRALSAFFAYKESIDMDTKDNNKKYLFDRAVKKLGPLSSDEVFGFEHALTIGGACSLDNIVKVNVFNHLSILAQLSERSIMGPNELAKASR